jgi:hypothetical protein
MRLTPTPSDEPHPAELPDAALLADCDVRRAKAAGPGGQRRNKVETAVTLKHRPTGAEAAAAERRSQPENQRVALRRLRLNLALEIRRTRREPSDLWTSRASGGKLAINPDHRDYPALLAEAMDFIDMHRGDAARAASAMGVNTSQLIKLLRHEPKALERVNADRRKRGKGKLK